MGTNYYLRQNHCPQCGRGDDRHIGKSSAGWVFALHVYPEDGINTLDDWKELFKSNPIRDECDRAFTGEDMLGFITERSWAGKDNPEGYSSRAQFHYENHSEDGPNGLLRSRVDGRHCIGHGEGTWDYHIGDFS